MNKAEYSKRSMAEALLHLMETEDYDRITIQQIVDEAGVSRMAFYRNFETKDQILQYYVDRITDEFVRDAHMKEKYDNAEMLDYFIAIFRHLTSQRKLSSLLIHAGKFDLVRGEFERILSYRAKDHKDLYRYHFLGGGICSIYYAWLVSGCEESVEELTDMILQVVTLPRSL